MIWRRFCRCHAAGAAYSGIDEQLILTVDPALTESWNPHRSGREPGALQPPPVLLLTVVAVALLAVGVGLARQAKAMADGGRSLRNIGPLEGPPLRKYTAAVFVMLAGIVAGFIVLIRVIKDAF